MISVTELGVVCLVALFAFGPKQLPQLVRVLGQAIAWLHRMRLLLWKQWDHFLKEQQLLDNQQKAERVEKGNPMPQDVVGEKEQK
jgi:Sec-independent protein translocase protein TatA